MKTVLKIRSRHLAFVGAGLAMWAGVLGFASLAKAQTPRPNMAGVNDVIKKRMAESRGRFIQNKGQWNRSARFLAQYEGLALWLTDKGWKIDQSRPTDGKKRSGNVVDFSLVGAQKPKAFETAAPGRTRFDFLYAKKSFRGIRGYNDVRAKEVYPGTDLRWYVQNDKPRFDFVLSPGADPSRLKVAVSGAQTVLADGNGELAIGTKVGQIRQGDLKAYQVVGGKRVPVSAKFKLVGKNTFGFELGAYDRSKELVIDPLVYGSYYGGNSLGMGVSGWDEVRAVTEDADFGVYVTGWTQSPQFPAIAGPYSFNISGSQDAFFSKFQGDAYNHDYSAFIGGSGTDTGQFVAMDPTGNHIWLAGTTTSADLPGITGSSFQGARAGASDAFLMRFTKDDVNVVVPDYATYYGSATNETLTGLAVAPISGDVIICGSTDGGLPSKNNSYLGGASDAYIARFVTNAGGIAALNYCFYVGGIGTDTGSGVAADADDNAYIVGTIASPVASTDTSVSPARFVTTPGVFPNGRLLRNNDAFIRKYDASGTMLYSALLGGNGNDSGAGVAVDPAGNAYMTGLAASFNFPRTPGVYGENFTATQVIYATKINQDGSQIVYSTHLRTAPPVSPAGIAVDTRGSAWVAGTAGYNIITFDTGDPIRPQTVVFGSITPTANALDPTYESPQPPDFPTTEGFIIGLTPTATNVVYASYLGGLLDEQVFAPAVNRFGDAWAVGSTDSARVIQLLSSTGALTIIQATASLPATLISPFAFKTVGDESQSLTTDPAWTGNWAPPPAQIATGKARDGFLVKHRETLPTITALTLNPPDVAGGLGATSVGTITLSGAVPAGGLDLTVTLNNGAASFTAGGTQSTLVLNLAAGATNAQFTIFTNPVTSPTQVEVKASLEGNFMSRILTVEPWLQQLSITPTSVVGGNNVTGRVTLWQAAISDVTIDLSTDGSGLVEFPNGATVTVPAGATTATFVIQTHGVGPQTDVPVTASLLGVGKTAFVRLLPANLVSVTFNPDRVTSGASSTGTVTLDGEAGPSFTVDLTLNAGTAGYVLNPTQLTFDPGDRSKTFTITTAFEAVNTQRIVTATRTAQGPYTLQSVAGTIFVDAASLISFTVGTTTVNSGGTVTGTVTINTPAGTGGAPIDVVTDNPVATVTSPVLIPAGSTSTNFPIAFSNTAVASDTVVTVTASRGPVSIQRQITLKATAATLSLNPNSVVGGNPSTATLSIASPAGVGGMTFNLMSSTGSAIVPATATITDGQSSTTFQVTTSIVTSDTLATITATSGSITANGSLNIQAARLVSLRFVPSQVKGGANTSLQVQIDTPAPVGGAIIPLTTSDPSLAVIPASMTVPQGQTSAVIVVPTRRVSRTLATQVSATYGSSALFAVLKVTR